MSKGKNTTTQSTEIDPQLMAIYKDVYNTGKTIANQPYLPYTGPRVAGFNLDQLTGFDATRNMFGQSMGYNPRRSLNALANMSAPSILDRNIGAYQNPYTQQVVDTTLADLDRSRQMAVSRDQDRAIGAGAFGGSRSGVLEAETNRAFADQAARTAAGLRQGGFDRATSLAGQDINREIGNRGFQAGLFGNQLADQYNNLGLLSGIGGQQQQFQQQALNQAYGQYADAMGYGQKQLGLLSQAAGLIPQQSTTTQTGRQETGAGDVLGTAAQLAAAFFMGSDQRMKKDITFIGKEKGHNIYSWNWNDKAKSIGWNKFPTVGVIAQEVKKYMPEAVIQDANGYYKVNYGVL
jgi:hypothetical protein